MGIKHSTTKSSRDLGLATDWNADHLIDSDVECGQYQHINHVIENRTDYPAGPVNGQVIYRTDTKTFEIWDGVAWDIISGLASGDFIKKDGTVVWTADQDVGNNKLTGVKDPTLNQDVATKKYVDDNAGVSLWEVDGTETQLKIADAIDMRNEDIINIKNITLSGSVDGIDVAGMSGFVALNTAHRNDNSQAHTDYLINNGDDTTTGNITSIAPTVDLHLATKKYVDDNAGVSLWEVDGTETQLKIADEIDMQTKKIINVVDPTANQEVATKKYVDDNEVESLWEVDGTETQLKTADEIDMQTKKIINVVDPTANQEVATKKYVDDNAGVSLWEVDGTETQLKTADEIDMQTKKIINVVDPTANQEVATKKYVDDNGGGLDYLTVNIPPGAMYSTGAYATSGNTVAVTCADGSTTDIYLNWHVPIEWGSRLKVGWQWYTPAGALDCVWRIDWSCAADGNDKDSASGNTGELIKTNRGADEINNAAYPIVGVVFNNSNLVSIKISRVGGSSNDTLSASAYLLNVYIEFTPST